MKRFALAILMLLPVGALGQTGALQGHCTLGGTTAQVSGLQSTNYMQGVIPSCTVTVYLTGTQTLATIYKDANNTPLGNPFTANAASSPDPGGWLFFAAISQGYDVVLSGGISPNVYATPVTMTAVYVSQQVTVTVAAGGTNGQIQYNNSGALGGSAATITSGGNMSTPGSVSATGNITSSGTVTAGSFSGDSSGLTGTAPGLSVGGTATGSNAPMIARFANGGLTITATVGCGQAPRSGTISKIQLSGNGQNQGTATVDISTASASSFASSGQAAATSITNGHPVGISSQYAATVSSFTGWTTTSIVGGNYYCFTLSSPANFTTLTVSLTY